MHRLMNRALQQFICDTYTPGVWKLITSRAGVQSGQIYTPLYNLLDDKDISSEIIALVKSAAYVLRKPRHEVLEDMGSYAVSHPNMGSLRRLLRYGGETFTEFLYSLDDFHERAQLAMPDMIFPRLRLQETGHGYYRLSCHWQQQGFIFVIIGLLRAMADDYGALVWIEPAGMDENCEFISITVAESSFAVGRAFSIARAHG